METITEEMVERQARKLQLLLARLMEPPEPPGDVLPDIELSPREIKVLLLLEERGEMTMTDFASAFHAPLSTLTRVMDRLERKI